MTRFLLAIDERAALAAQGFDEVLLWTGGRRSSFTGTLGPHLESFGPVARANIDFARIALGVFAADRSVRRRAGGSDWNARDLALTVELNDPGPWNANREELARVIGFLTGDHWSFNLTQAALNEVAPLAVDDANYSRTVLLSGGADSAAGALLSACGLQPRQNQALVSHFSSKGISPFQKNLVAAINRLAPQQTSFHQQTYLSRGSKRLDGTHFRDESSSRSRSVLFLALGLAMAERAGTPLLMPENGFASLNPPLGPERRGALSTRTTHPRFLSDLQALLGAMGAHNTIEEVVPFPVELRWRSS